MKTNVEILDELLAEQPFTGVIGEIDSASLFRRRLNGDPRFPAYYGDLFNKYIGYDVMPHEVMQGFRTLSDEDIEKIAGFMLRSKWMKENFPDLKIEPIAPIVYNLDR